MGHANTTAPATAAAATPLDSIKALLAPKSIAVVGASERQGAQSRRLLESLQTLAFPGPIYPIHPTSKEVQGLRCYPSLATVPGPVDVVACSIDVSRTLDALREAAAIGARAAVIFGGVRDSEHATATETRSAIVATVRNAGMALCGPNCMGVLNPAARSAMYSGVIIDKSRLAGNVALVTQSGSVAVGMLGDVRRFGFSHLISSGDESVTTIDRYVEALIDDEHTAVIALFIEAVRNVAGFAAALERARRVGKPVVALKIGRNVKSREAAVGHTGAVAGDGRVFSALMVRHGGIEVTSLEELTEVVACCQAERRPKGPRVGIVTASGGQVEMILDEVEGALFELPGLSQAEIARAASVIGPVSGAGNPLDSWGTGDFTRSLAHGFDVIASSPAIDSVVLVSDTNDGQAMAPTRYTDLFHAASERFDKPFYFMNTRSNLMRMELVEQFRGSGVGMLTGLRQGLGAIGRMGRWAQYVPPAPPVEFDTRGADAALQKALSRERKTINEVDAKTIFRALGLGAVADHVVASTAEARKAAAAVGYPVALKVASDSIPHRSEHGLVTLGLRTPDDVAATFDKHAAIVAKLRRDADVAQSPLQHVLQPMAAPGVEVIVGVGRDPELGAYIVFGAGGVLVELIGDAVVLPLPLRQGEARKLVMAAKVARLLGGYRNHTPRDVAAVVDLVERIAAFAWANRDRIGEIDLNPVFVHRADQGCTIADALIVPSAKGGSE